MAQGEKQTEQLTEEEKEFIRILRNHKDGAKAFEIALNIIIAEIENEQKNSNNGQIMDKTENEQEN